jgi:transmembrane sensor
MNTQTRQEAAEWLIELQLDAPDAAARERFVEWLRTSPENVRAYLEVVSLWDDAQHYDAGRELDVDALTSRARNESNLITLDTCSNPEPRAGAEMDVPVTEPRFRQTGLAAAVVAVVTLVLLGVWLGAHYEHSYATDVGEQRTVKLADGSIAELNAVSRIRVRFSDRERRVDLLQGQALFRVAKNPARPFVVVSGDTRVRAVGTEFDVNRKASGTVVTVVEGRVAVVSQPAMLPNLTPAANTPHSIELSAGEQVDIGESRPGRKAPANLAAVTAWTQHQLVFESTPLAEVAEQFNRFNFQKLIVEGDSIRHLQISGNFPALDSTSLPRFVRFLREQPGVTVSESPEQIRVTSK